MTAVSVIQVNGGRGDVEWSDNAFDGQRLAQLLAPRIEPVAEIGADNGVPTKLAGNEVDADRCQLAG